MARVSRFPVAPEQAFSVRSEAVRESGKARVANRDRGGEVPEGLFGYMGWRTLGYSPQGDDGGMCWVGRGRCGC